MDVLAMDSSLGAIMTLTNAKSLRTFSLHRTTLSVNGRGRTSVFHDLPACHWLILANYQKKCCVLVARLANARLCSDTSRHSTTGSSLTVSINGVYATWSSQLGKQ